MPLIFPNRNDCKPIGWIIRTQEQVSKISSGKFFVIGSNCPRIVETDDDVFMFVYFLKMMKINVLGMRRSLGKLVSHLALDPKYRFEWYTAYCADSKSSPVLER